MLSASCDPVAGGPCDIHGHIAQIAVATTYVYPFPLCLPLPASRLVSNIAHRGVIERGAGTMPYRTLSVRSIGVGSKELGSAILTLQRDDPEPGVRGLKSWQFSGQTDRAGLLPEEAELTATLDDGRELNGLAILTSHRIDM